jgi:hypothetical protein
MVLIAQVIGRVGRRRGKFYVERYCLKRSVRACAVLIGILLLPSLVRARDLGVLIQPIHQGKFTSSLLYEYLKVTDDFDIRGQADFTGQVAGAELTYGITDQIAIGLKGGTILDPKVKTQGTEWKSRSGYLYGLDIYDEVFPATPGWTPGVQVSGGVTGYQVPLDQIVGSTSAVNQMMTGVEYHGAVLTVFKIAQAMPYAGLRVFGGQNTWRDNNASLTGSPDHITGHAHGSFSVVVGLPVQIAKEVRLQLEGRFISETAVTAGLTIAAF